MEPIWEGTSQSDAHAPPANNRTNEEYLDSPNSHFSNITKDKESDNQSKTYIGRSYYVKGQADLDEDLARSYHPAKVEGVTSIELKTLELWNSFELPPLSIRKSFMEAFMEYCYPWMPTLSVSEIHQGGDRLESLLLMQSVFLAASRLSSSSSSLNCPTPEQFYHRAKTLFWTGHETDPLTVIKSITMLQWYNPDGPAHVSYDGSEFWLKIGVGLAFQIGLHKELPLNHAGRSLRRRIWWSLVVSLRSIRIYP